MATDAQAVRAATARTPAGGIAAGFRAGSPWSAIWTPLVWTSLALGGGIGLHADRVPLWATGLAFVLIAWRLAASRGVVRLPGKFPRAFIAFALVGAVLANYHTLNGLTPGTTLLILMAAIKLLETHSRRDQYIVVGGVLFLLLAACLDRQNLPRAPLYLAEVWACCAAFAVIAYTPAEPRQPAVASNTAAAAFDNRAAVLLAGRALLYSVPLAIVLFIFFPRLPGAFWSLPHSGEAETGLGDTMSPGSISELTSSYDIAFRVAFDGPPPPPAERYWRGPVLHDFDGYTWSRGQGTTYRTQLLEYTGTAYRYQVSLEPSQQRWWFSLDTVDHSPDPNVFFTYDYELVARDPVTETTTYTAVSHTLTRSTEPLSKLARQVETRWPLGRNPRSLQLAREMRSRVASDRAYVAAVLQLFKTGGFVYSLAPPLLNYDSVDDFLFNTHSGFCGHYASAFVTLMRGAGIPARVVTGYLGGEWNPIGGYFVIRQSDAHSWAEIWLERQGWMRVDPTAMVEPERLTRGILDLLPNVGSMGARFARSSPGLNSLLQRWDAINTWWTNHVLQFDYRSQLNLLSQLGIRSPDLTTVAWGFALALMTWLAWIAWQVGRGVPQARPDRLARAYARLCRKLGRIGVPRLAHQGPLAYADEVSTHRPDLAETARSLLARYADLRYGAPRGDSLAADIVSFERAVSRFELP